MSFFGQLVLCMAMVMSAVGGSLVLAGRKPGTKRAGETLLLGAAAAGATALLVLAFLLLNHDYRNAYVFNHADRNMGTGYLLCAVWGGQGGSLLFWAALQTFFTAAMVLWNKEKPRFALGFLAALQAYFIAMVLFHSNPFEPLGRIAMRGIGMNPLLLNPFMAIHPPTLFLGFVGSSVPAALAFQALVDKTFRPDWLDRARPWILFAWLFLSVGNMLGMVWAYEELGWGGFWGWDPVENASFMPWLTSTALVHIALVKKPAKTFYFLGVLLPVLTFALIVFGTFITRSGVIQSVHAFSDTTVGPYLLGLIILLGVLLAGLAIYRRKALSAPEEAPGFLRREKLVRYTTWILLMSTTFVWIGTMAPLFTELFKGEKVASTPAFFNKWMVPLGLSLLFVLAVCLVAGAQGIGAKSGRWKGILRSVGLPLTAGIVSAVAGTLLLGFNGPAALISFALLGITVAAVAGEIFRIARRVVDDGDVSRGRRARLGAQIVHAATLCLFLGFTGQAFISESTAVMRDGDSMDAGDYQLKFLGLRDDNDYRRYAIFADLAVSRSGKDLGTYATARFFYHSHPNQPTSEVAIMRTLPNDLFLILGNIDEQTEAATIRAIVNPLVSFIWIGGVLLVLGTFLSFSAFAAAPSTATAAEVAWWKRPVIAAGTVLLLLGATVVSFVVLPPSYPLLVLIALSLGTMVWAFGRALPGMSQGEPS